MAYKRLTNYPPTIPDPPAFPVGTKRGRSRYGRGFYSNIKITNGTVDTPESYKPFGTSPWLAKGQPNPLQPKQTINAGPVFSIPVADTNAGKYFSSPDGKYKSNPVTGTGSKRASLFSKENIDKFNKVVNDVSPYISNISNAFRKAPRPSVPMLDSYTNLSKIDLSNERSAVKRTVDAAGKATERNVDANTAEAIKAFNRGQEFNQLSAINERETNTNVGIGNQQAMMDAQVKGANIERWNDYGNAKTAADIADVRERSANVANAGDKFTMIQNEKNKARVERDKVRVLSSLYNKSGVLSRQAREWKKMGIEDPLGMDYTYAESDEDAKKREGIKAYGGMMKRIPNRKLLV